MSQNLDPGKPLWKVCFGEGLDSDWERLPLDALTDSAEGSLKSAPTGPDTAPGAPSTRGRPGEASG